MKDATQFHIRPARPDEAGLFFAQHPAEDERLGTIGHVRMDFGRSGNEFWHTVKPTASTERYIPPYSPWKAGTGSSGVWRNAASPAN